MSPKIVVFSPKTHVLFSIVNMLRGSGFRIAPIQQHPSSVQQIERLKPDVLIVDNESVFSQMALEVVKTLKSNAQLASIPVICATVASKQHELAHLPGVAVYTTPITSSSLLERIRQVLGVPAEA